MKKILLQLDTDPLPSSFDRIVPYDAGVDEVLSYGGVKPADVTGLIHGAFFTRGVPDLKNTAVWIGGSDVALGEQLLATAQKAFFGPFKVSLMLDSNGCNTTAATAIAKLAKQGDLKGQRAVVIGQGPVGLRAARLLQAEGCDVIISALPKDLLGDRFNAELAVRGMAAAEGAGLPAMAPVDREAMEGLLEDAQIAVAAGPAGVQVLRKDAWATRSNLRLVLDFNLTEPLGVEGMKPGDDLKEREGKLTLGPLAIGNPKMKVHKACLGKLFETNELVLDAEGVYEVAKGII